MEMEEIEPHVVALRPLTVGKGLRPARAPRERDPEGWLTIKQAAARLGVSERTLREHMRSGAVPYVDVGRGKVRRSPRFAPSDLQEFQNRQRGQSWPSTSAAKSTGTSSTTGVLDFAALRAARAARSPRVRARQAARGGEGSRTS